MKIYIGPTNGSYTNITEYIASEGVKWSTDATICSGSGNNLNGETMRVVQKWKDSVDMVCRALTTTQRNTIINILKANYLKVKITDDNDTTVSEFDCLTDSIGVSSLTKSGLWIGLSFSLEMK